MKKSIFTILLSFCAFVIYAQQITGTWHGNLNIGGVSLPVVIHVEPTEDGLLGTMDSPDQKAYGIPVTEVTFGDKKFRFRVNSLNVLYEGEMTAPDTISGIFTQGTRFPLTLVRGDYIPPVVNRPQEPRPPFPYMSEEVRVPNETDPDIVLAGTLTIPEGEGPFPAVIMVTGSGPQDRNEEMVKHKPFLVIADHLTREGIAVFRYDDRGYGESTGNYFSSHPGDFLEDAISVLRYLRRRPEVDSTRVGVIGHSEGGFVSFMAAARYPEVNFIIPLAGVASPGKDLLRKQTLSILMLSGVSEEVADNYVTTLLHACDIVSSHTFMEVHNNIDEFTQEAISKADQPLDPMWHNQIKNNLRNLASPAMRYLVESDISQEVRKITVPVFAAFADKDIQVDARMQTSVLFENLPEETLKISLIKTYPGLNHLFQHAETGAVHEYEKIEETFAPEVLDDMVRFIRSL